MKLIFNSDDYLEENDDYLFNEGFNQLFENTFGKGFIIIVEASNTDWRGRSGYAEVTNIDKLKSLIIDGNHFESTRIYATDKNKLLKIISSGHDVPTGCSMNCYAITEKNAEKYEKFSDMPLNKTRPIVYDEKNGYFKVHHLSCETFNLRQSNSK